MKPHLLRFSAAAVLAIALTNAAYADQDPGVTDTPAGTDTAMMPLTRRACTSNDGGTLRPPAVLPRGIEHPSPADHQVDRAAPANSFFDRK